MSFWYLGSPYSKYPEGKAAAFARVCENAGYLIKAGVPVFSPIAHSHWIALFGHIDPDDHAIWLPADEPFMVAAKGMIVLKLEGWDTSFGLSCEIPHFRHTGRPVVFMEDMEFPEGLIQ